MAYSTNQRAAMAQAIDKMLGTSAASTDGSTTDLMLDWMTALVVQLANIQSAMKNLVQADTRPGPPPPPPPPGPP